MTSYSSILSTRNTNVQSHLLNACSWSRPYVFVTRTELLNIFDATDAPRDSRGRAVGKKRKSLGIKLKRCVQVVWPAYKTSGMKRIVLFVVNRAKLYSHFNWSICVVHFWTYMWMFSLQSVGFWDPGQFVHLIYCDRMRTVQDKQMVNIVQNNFCGCNVNSVSDYMMTSPLWRTWLSIWLNVVFCY